MSPEMQAFEIQWFPQASQLRSAHFPDGVKDAWLALSGVHRQNNPAVIRGLWNDLMSADVAIKMIFLRYLLIEPDLEAVMKAHALTPDPVWNEAPYVRPLALIAMSFLMSKPGDAATIVNFVVYQAIALNLPYVDFEMLCRMFPGGAWTTHALDTLYDTGKGLFCTREIPEALHARILEIRNA